MQRRTLLQMIGTATVAVPFSRVRLWAQPRELTADGVPEARATAMVVAAGEIVVNAERHGRGTQAMRVNARLRA